MKDIEQKMALLQNSPFRNSTDKKPLKNKDNFLKKSPNLPFRNSAKIDGFDIVCS